jgi:hypothetical protein
MKYIVSNYHNDLSWIPAYTNDYIIYDQSGTSTLPNTVKRKHQGSDIHDKLSYIISNYDNLPDACMMIKGNLFKYITKEEFDLVKDNTTFTPLLTKHHKTGLPLCFYSEDGLYNELNESSYVVGTNLPRKFYTKHQDFAKDFNLPSGEYLRFAPGSNYIIPRQNIHKHPKTYYKRLRAIIDYTGYSCEAQMIERSLYEIFK